MFVMNRLVCIWNAQSSEPDSIWKAQSSEPDSIKSDYDDRRVEKVCDEMVWSLSSVDRSEIA